MFKEISELVPASVALSAVLWGGVSYFATGPEIASRIALADHVPACETGYEDAVSREADRQRASLPVPAVDPLQEGAMQEFRRFQGGPLGRSMRENPLEQLFGFGRAFDLVDRQFREQSVRAEEAYRRAIDSIDAEMATRLGAAGDHCGCLADAAIADTRTEWALYAGSLGLLRQDRIRDFDAVMARTSAGGDCSAVGWPES